MDKNHVEHLYISEFSRLLDAGATMAGIQPLRGNCEDNRTHVIHTCPIIDTYFLTPELSITYVPVLKETSGLRKHKGHPELKLVVLPKRGDAILMPYMPENKDGQIYMKTPKGLCCCPTCVKLVLSRCSDPADWGKEICKVYELEGHITPARYQRTEQMFQSWDSAFPQPPVGLHGDLCYPFPPTGSTT